MTMFDELFMFQYQNQALSTLTVEPEESEKDLICRIGFGLVGEAGETAEKLKKWLRGDYSRGELKELMKGELGDLLWYVATMADILGLDLNDIANINLAKLQDRKERGVIKGSGDSR